MCLQHRKPAWNDATRLVSEWMVPNCITSNRENWLDGSWISSRLFNCAFVLLQFYCVPTHKISTVKHSSGKLMAFYPCTWQLVAWAEHQERKTSSSLENAHAFVSIKGQTFHWVFTSYILGVQENNGRPALRIHKLSSCAHGWWIKWQSQLCCGKQTPRRYPTVPAWFQEYFIHLIDK